MKVSLKDLILRMRSSGINISRDTSEDDLFYRLNSFLYSFDSKVVIDNNGQEMLARLTHKLADKDMYFPDYVFCHGCIPNSTITVAADIKDTTSPFSYSEIGKIVVYKDVYIGYYAFGDTNIKEIELLGNNDSGGSIFKNSSIGKVILHNVKLGRNEFKGSLVDTLVLAPEFKGMKKDAIVRINAKIYNIVIENPNLTYDDFQESSASDNYSSILGYILGNIVSNYIDGSCSLESVKFGSKDSFEHFMTALKEILHEVFDPDFLADNNDDVDAAQEAFDEFIDNLPIKFYY